MAQPELLLEFLGQEVQELVPVEVIGIDLKSRVTSGGDMVYETDDSYMSRIGLKTANFSVDPEGVVLRLPKK